MRRWDIVTHPCISLAHFVNRRSGIISFVDAKGKLSQRATLKTAVSQLTYCQERAILVAACRDISLSAFRAGPDGTLMELGRVKLSGQHVSMDWIAPGVLASATGDSSLKLWDLQRQEHHLVQAWVRKLNSICITRAERIDSNLTLGNRNFVPEVTFVQKLYDWDRLSKRIKNLCRATKFVHVIGCQGENKFLGILKKSI